MRRIAAVASVVALAAALAGPISCEPNGGPPGERAEEAKAAKEETKLPLPPQASKPAPGPEQGGLASLYPGDLDIERDPRVIFVDDFETGTVKEIGARWGEVSKAGNMDLNAEVHAGSPGTKSIHIKQNGHLYTHTRPVDTMYCRFYVRFHPKHGYNHHFVHIVADRHPTPWPKGGAGTTPAGDMKFSTGIEPTGRWGKVPPPGVWNFYSYWHQMKSKWGSVFNGKQTPIERGRWYCVEAMVKANSSPEKSDGEQAFWVDGELYGRFEGFNWRSTDKLKLNSFWLLYYNTDQPARHNKDPDPASRVMEVWFDDVVVATEYIGPVVGRPRTRDGRKAARPSTSALLTPGLAIAAPGKVIYRCDFEKGSGGFKAGEVVPDGAGGGGRAYAVPPKGVNLWDAFSTGVKDSTTVRFRLKNLSDKNKALVMIWSKKAKDNCRHDVWLPKKGEWKTVEFRAT